MSRLSARWSRPAIDCFYVYPLVSLQTAPNTTLRIDPQETAIAELEASPFSRVCRVFAPMYRQVTLRFVSSQAAQQVAYDSPRRTGAGTTGLLPAGDWLRR